MAEQRKNPYPHQNFSIVADYLEEMVLILSEESGKLPIAEASGGYEEIVVDDTAAVALNVPAKAISADISFEADNTSTNKSKVMRFKENGSDPSTASGLPFGEGILKVIGMNNLSNFRIIGIEAGKNHTIQVQYYQTIQTI